MKISTKLTLFLAGVLLLFVGLAASLNRQIEQVTAGYNAILAKPIRAADRARVMQVDFKKQVQEWKDILLRGHTPADLDKYTKNFHKQGAATQARAQELIADIDDAQAEQMVTEFMAEHVRLSKKYERAYQAYVSGGFDFKTADTIVRGQDRALTDLCDNVVARLDVYTKQSVAAQQAAVATARKTTLGVAGILLLVLGSIGLLIVSSISTRLNRLKAVLVRVANAEFDGLALEVAGRDEIGEFADSMKGVLAAFEELHLMAGNPNSQAGG